MSWLIRETVGNPETNDPAHEVGYFHPCGEWQGFREFQKVEDAIEMCNCLNGGASASTVFYMERIFQKLGDMDLSLDSMQGRM